MSTYHQELPGGIRRVRISGESWYQEEKGAPYAPSVTWITKYSPENKDGLINWAARTFASEEGYKAFMKKAGERGTAVHDAVEAFFRDGMADKGHLKEEVWDYVLPIENFDERFAPDVQALEHSFVLEPSARFAKGYSGTADLLASVERYRLDKDPGGDDVTGTLAVFDWKTSKSIYKSHLMQIAAYCHAFDIDFGFVVRLGTQHKKFTGFNGPGFEAVPVDLDRYLKLFDLAYAGWMDEHAGRHGPRFAHKPKTITRKKR